MRLLYHARHVADAHFIKNLLEEEGIAAIVRGEFLASGIGELPADVLSVWIVNDAQLEKAETLLRDLARGRMAAGRTPWNCANCGERLEAQFTECWSCGTARPNEPAA
ncbi:MAG: DUF2007 domain-containing protein [Burkholderiales bacterium]